MWEIRPGERDALPEIRELLEVSDLPVDGIDEHVERFLLACDDDGLLGTIGMEVYGNVGLLRSLAVRSRTRGAGVGRALVEALLDGARAEGLTEMYLLTTTADAYFPRFGFETIPRESVDARLHASEEFRGACPDSAVCMRLRL